MNVREGFVDAEGHRLAYLAVNEHLLRADEPAVVFIHGVLASVNFWRDCVPPQFKEGRAWYSLSLPAHHPSLAPRDFSPAQVDAQWFSRVMGGAIDALLDGRQAIVVGHSTGGFSALNLAVHQARNVIGVVSVAGFHAGKWGSVEGQLLWLSSLGNWARYPFYACLLLARSSRFVQRLFASLLAYDRKAYLSNALSERMLDNIRSDTSQQDPAALFPLFNGISRIDIGHRLPEIRIPCHVLAGSHDPVVPASQSLVIAGKVPAAKTTVFRDVGHMPFIEDADACFGAIDAALIDIARSYGGGTQASTRR